MAIEFPGYENNPLAGLDVGLSHLAGGVDQYLKNKWKRDEEQDRIDRVMRVISGQGMTATTQAPSTNVQTPAGPATSFQEALSRLENMGGVRSVEDIQLLQALAPQTPEDPLKYQNDDVRSFYAVKGRMPYDAKELQDHVAGISSAKWGEANKLKAQEMERKAAKDKVDAERAERQFEYQKKQDAIKNAQAVQRLAREAAKTGRGPKVKMSVPGGGVLDIELEATTPQGIAEELGRWDKSGYKVVDETKAGQVVIDESGQGMIVNKSKGTYRPLVPEGQTQGQPLMAPSKGDSGPVMNIEFVKDGVVQAIPAVFKNSAERTAVIKQIADENGLPPNALMVKRRNNPVQNAAEIREGKNALFVESAQKAADGIASLVDDIKTFKTGKDPKTGEAIRPGGDIGTGRWESGAKDWFSRNLWDNPTRSRFYAKFGRLRAKLFEYGGKALTKQELEILAPMVPDPSKDDDETLMQKLDEFYREVLSKINSKNVELGGKVIAPSIGEKKASDF